MKKIFLYALLATTLSTPVLEAKKQNRPPHGDYTTGQVALANLANVAANAITLVHGGDPGQCILQIMQSIFNIAMAAAEDDDEKTTLEHVQYRLNKILKALSSEERKELKRQIKNLLKTVKKEKRARREADRSTP